MESIVIKKNKWYSFHGSGSVCLSVATKTILYFRVTIYCLFEKEKTLRLILGRPSRSDLVQFQFYR